MKVAELLEQRKIQWAELDGLCSKMASRRTSSMTPEDISRFARLYRNACADLALANAYQLPPSTVQYLHNLVGRAHNQLYRGQGFQTSTWSKLIFSTVPKLIFRDRCTQFVFVLFWGLFILSALHAYNDPEFAARVIGQDQVKQMSEMHGDSPSTRSFSFGAGFAGMGFYIWNNAGIGLQCFAYSTLFLPGLATIAFNAVQIGTVFGYMFRPEMGATRANFQEFVTAHGPFELTAIILSGGAGIRIGLGLVYTRGLTRLSSVIKAGREAMPIAGVATILFFMAAFIEGFISPSPLPWTIKSIIALISSLMLVVYFVVLGFPRGDEDDEI